MAGFQNDVVFGTGLDFSGGSPVTNQMVSDGQLLIGSTALNVGGTHINVATLTAGTGISITNGPGSIIITNTGGGGGGGGTNSLMGNSGSATQVGGVISVPGTTGITTSGAGSTLTISPANDLAALEALAGTGYAVRTGVETWALRTFQAGTGITLSNADGVSGNTTITASASVPTTFTEDSGSATPAANNLNILGTSSQGVSTSGAGATVTITAANASALQKGVASFNATNFTVTAGDVASNALTITAGTGLTNGGSVNLGGAVTVALDIPVTVPHGGTGQTALTINGVLYGNTASPVGVTTAGSNGQVLIGATGAPPAFGTITGTNGITLTPGANSLTISNVNIPNSALANSSITINAGAGISVVGSPVSLGGAVTISTASTIATQFTSDSGVVTPSGNNVNIFGTSAQGISTSGSGATLTITAANATTAAKGVASFNPSDFTVSSGAVSLLTTPIGTLTPNEDFDGSAATPVAPQAGTISILGSNPSFATVTETYNTTGASTGNFAVENRAWLTGLVVDSSTTPGTRGTYSTIASALIAAVSGQTIFIRTGTYTENLTLKAGVNLSSFECDGYTPNVTILGTCTASFTGTVSISGIELKTNGANALSVSGSNATNLFLINCVLNANNAQWCTINNANSKTSFITCLSRNSGNNALFTITNCDFVKVYNCGLPNDSATSTPNTIAAGELNIYNSNVGYTNTTSSTGLIKAHQSFLDTGFNATTITTAGTGNSQFFNCNFNSGSASAISIGSGTAVVMANCSIHSSATNVITGAGELRYTPVSCTLTGSGVTTTTQTTKPMGPRILLTGGCEIVSGSGSPNGVVTSPKGSIFLRTDGSTTNNRAYINTNGGTTWTALTTVA